MATVEVARDAGACFGVERALSLVEETVGSADGAVCTLGPLIHNPRVVGALANEGVHAVGRPEECPDGATLVLRTHGVTPEVEREAHEMGLKLLDATCPFVKKVHKAAARLEHDGYEVLVVGEAGHPEVEGTLGHTEHARVVGSAEELVGMRLGRRVGVVVQTTLAVAVLEDVVSALVRRCEEVRVVNTICEATTSRQNAADELAARADVMVVVGGRNSANTTHLAEICAARCEKTYHVEEAGELEAGWFAGAGLAGLTAGASTPAAHIEAVRARVEELCG